MKKKGRYVVEASYLVPVICILLVYLVFFTLYAHDYAVCAHTVLTSGVKGCYQDGRTGEERREETEKELAQKLSGRLLWLEDEAVEVQVNPVRFTIRMSGKGNFLPVSGIVIEREIYRVQPCETLRRSRWMRD